MQTVYPDYYKDFKCINKDCKHNCCIGWEIDIDDETAEIYRNFEGDFGDKLRANICWDEQPFFKLSKDDRCPFLNDCNLCEIIINSGEGALCDICSEHPRFTNQLPERNEIGLGLCCEEAARIILSKKDAAKLIVNGESKTSDEIVELRDKILFLLQNREKSIDSRIDDMLKICNCALPQKELTKFIDFLFTLERLDDKWSDILNLLKSEIHDADFEKFNIHMKHRQTEYEQLLVYFIYRHFANAPQLIYTSERAIFAAVSYKIIYSIGAVIFNKTNNFTLEDQIEICRMYSSEIEYSDENLYSFFDFIFN